MAMFPRSIASITCGERATNDGRSVGAQLRTPRTRARSVSACRCECRRRGVKHVWRKPFGAVTRESKIRKHYQNRYCATAETKTYILDGGNEKTNVTAQRILRYCTLHAGTSCVRSKKNTCNALANAHARDGEKRETRKNYVTQQQLRRSAISRSVAVFRARGVRLRRAAPGSAAPPFLLFARPPRALFSSSLRPPTPGRRRREFGAVFDIQRVYILLCTMYRDRQPVDRDLEEYII